MAICDRCQIEISNDGGYLVYSESKMMGMMLGTLLLCENCANGLFTDEVWKRATQTATEIDISADFSEVMKAQRQAANFSIAMRAKRRGLNAAQARQEAREIAKLWWTDKQAAEQQLLDQATAKPGVQLSAEKKTSDVDSGKQKGQTSGRHLVSLKNANNLFYPIGCVACGEATSGNKKTIARSVFLNKGEFKVEANFPICDDCASADEKIKKRMAPVFIISSIISFVIIIVMMVIGVPLIWSIIIGAFSFIVISFIVVRPVLVHTMNINDTKRIELVDECVKLHLLSIRREEPSIYFEFGNSDYAKEFANLNNGVLGK